MTGTLLAHCGAKKVSRAELVEIRAPQETATWKPISHADLIATIEDELQHRGVEVKAEAFAIQRGGALLFGVLDLGWRNSNELGPALGLRTANDKSMSLQIAVGVRVFVCDNLAFSGDLIALRRKHTSGLDLKREISGALSRYQDGLVKLESEIDRMKVEELQDRDAKAIIFDAFHRQLLPSRFFRPVSERFFAAKGDVPEARARTLWGLHNAFTSEIKKLPPGPAFRATVQVGKLLGLGK